MIVIKCYTWNQEHPLSIWEEGKTAYHYKRCYSQVPLNHNQLRTMTVVYWDQNQWCLSCLIETIMSKRYPKHIWHSDIPAVMALTDLENNLKGPVVQDQTVSHLRLNHVLSKPSKSSLETKTNFKQYNTKKTPFVSWDLFDTFGIKPCHRVRVCL